MRNYLFPWQHWQKPEPVNPEEIAEAQEAVATAASRKVDTTQALVRRRQIVAHNHLAYDIRQAMERRA